MEKFELDNESQLEFIALNQNLNAVKAFINERLSESASMNAKYVDLINNSFVAANESNQPVIVSEYSIGNEGFQKEFDNYKDFINHVSPFSMENNELTSKEPEAAFKRPETYLKDELHLKLFNETQVDVKEIMASVEKHQYGFEAYQLDQSLKLVQGFVKEQQKVGGIDDGHAEIILQSKVDMNTEEKPIIKVDSSYKGKEISGEFQTIEEFGQSVLEDYKMASNQFNHPMKGKDQSWDKLINKVEQGIRLDNAEKQRDNHIVYGVNEHWNALIEKVAMSENEVSKATQQVKEPNQTQEKEVINSLVGDAADRAETIMNAQHHEQQKALTELSVPLLKQYEGKTLSSKDIEKITNAFQENLANSLEKYSDQKSSGVNWTERISKLKEGISDALQDVKEKTISSLQSIKAIPENTKDLVRQKMLEVVVKANTKIQKELSRAEERLGAPEKASETFSKTTDGKYTEKKNENVFSLKGVKAIDQKINQQIKEQDKSVNKAKEQQSKVER